MLLRRLALLALGAVAVFLLVLHRREEPAPTAAAAPGAAVRDVAAEGVAVATFAGGCFWCMEPPFDAVPGVSATISGYAGGHLANPTYEDVSSGMSGHAEVVRIEYDPQQVSYGQLLDIFWRNIDPLAANRQFCDHGPQYRSAIFYHDEEQRRLAQASLDVLAGSGRFSEPIRTELVPAAEFYPAEDYHQDYATKNPVRYKYYRFSCGRDQRLREVWGDDAPATDADAEAAVAQTAAAGQGGAPEAIPAEAGGEPEEVQEPELLRGLLQEALESEGLSADERELLQSLIERVSGVQDGGVQDGGAEEDGAREEPAPR